MTASVLMGASGKFFKEEDVEAPNGVKNGKGYIFLPSLLVDLGIVVRSSVRFGVAKMNLVHF